METEGSSESAESTFDAAASPEIIKKLTLPASINTAEAGIYQKLTGLEEVVFSGGLVRAEKSAFKNCKNLKRVTGAEKLEYVEDEAFYNCSALEKIEYSWRPRARWCFRPALPG